VVVGEFLGGESGGGLGYLIIQSLGTLNAADMMVALLTLGLIGIVMRSDQAGRDAPAPLAAGVPEGRVTRFTVLTCC